MITFEWSSAFASQHAIDRYRVLMSPDPSNCNSDRVNVIADFTCSGLETGVAYNITVSAIIDCRNQEGAITSFTIELPQSKL